MTDKTRDYVRGLIKQLNAVEVELYHYGNTTGEAFNDARIDFNNAIRLLMIKFDEQDSIEHKAKRHNK